MIIRIWLSILMHFMHVVQMIFLLNVYMLIIKFTFYSLTLKSKAKHINIFWLKITLKRVFEENFLLKWLNLKLKTRIETESEHRFDFEKFSSSKKFSKNNINNYSIIENRKSKIKHRKLKIVVQNLTAINQWFETWKRTAETKSFRNRNCFSVYWTKVQDLKIASVTIRRRSRKLYRKRLSSARSISTTYLNFIEAHWRRNIDC